MRSAWVVLLAACASAPPRPALSRPLASLSPLLGSWECRGESRDAPDAEPRPAQATWSFAPDLEGAALRVHARGAERLAGHITRDPTGERFVAALVTGDGETRTEGSGGWDGDRLEFYGGLGEPRLQTRRTFQLSRGALEIVFALKPEGGDFVDALALSCTRR